MFPRELIAAHEPCADLLRQFGVERYALDCLARHLLAGDGAWPRALAMGLDPSAPELVIQAGIGRLRIGPGMREWEPATRGTPPPLPMQASPEVQAARLAACVVCDRYRDGRCSVAGCGCAGQGTPGALYSKCPLDRWP